MMILRRALIITHEKEEEDAIEGMKMVVPALLNMLNTQFG